MSGYPRDERLDELPDELIAGWLQKPFSIEELGESVARALRQEAPGNQHRAER